MTADPSNPEADGPPIDPQQAAYNRGWLEGAAWAKREARAQQATADRDDRIGGFSVAEHQAGFCRDLFGERVEDLRGVLRAVLRSPHAPSSWDAHHRRAVDCACDVHEDARRALTPAAQPERCGAWDGCSMPKGHNMGRADIPENHA